MDQHAKFNGKYIGKRGYIGKFSSAGRNVNIGESAVVHEYVTLKPNTNVNPTDIVIRTPTSILLYRRATEDLSSDEYVQLLRL